MALEQAGLVTAKLSQFLYMRLADDKVASKAIEDAVNDCTLSALNGKIHVPVPEILVVDSLPRRCALLGAPSVGGWPYAPRHARHTWA